MTDLPKGKITLKIVKGTGLDAKDLKSSDPYCKAGWAENGVYVDPKLVLATQKVKHSLNPVWNYVYVFTTPQRGDEIKIEVWDANLIMKDLQMGKCSIPSKLIVEAAGKGVVTHELQITHHKPNKVAHGTITVELQFETSDASVKVNTVEPSLATTSAASSAAKVEHPEKPKTQESPASTSKPISEDDYVWRKSVAITAQKRQAKHLLDAIDQDHNKLDVEHDIIASKEAEASARFAEIVESQRQDEVQTPLSLFGQALKSVVHYLDGYTIAVLFYTGNKEVHRVLSSSVNRMEISINMRRHGALKCYPNLLMACLKRCEHVSFKYNYGSTPLLKHDAATMNFPPNLRELHFRIGIFFRGESFKMLPHTLVEFTTITGLFNDQLEALPRHLSKLQFDGACLKDDSFALLPRGLTSLDILNSSIAIQRKTTDDAIAFLPRGLKRFTIGFPYTTPALYLLPPGLEILSIYAVYGDNDAFTDDAIAALPPNLTELRLKNSIKFTDEAIGFIPRSVTLLDIPFAENITPGSFSKMPPNLKYLDIHGVDISNPAAFQNLPASCETLLISLSKIQGGSSIKLPPNLTRLEGNGGINISNGIFASLPNTLKEIGFINSPDLSHQAFEMLPKALTSLDLFQSRGITLPWFAKLPRGLTRLRIEAASGVTSASIKDLPREITHLALGGAQSAIEDLKDDGCADFPPGLTNLSLGMSSISDAGIASFPKSITRLEMFTRTVSHKACIEHLPDLVSCHLRISYMENKPGAWFCNGQSK